jgi:hypothetical protein
VTYIAEGQMGGLDIDAAGNIAYGMVATVSSRCGSNGTAWRR